MKLTVKNLRNEFGLEKECEYLFHNKHYQGAVYVYGNFSQSSLVFKFDNKIDYFEFLVEAKALIENNVWNSIRFSSSHKTGTANRNEAECLECAIDINKRTQEILEKYIEQRNDNKSNEEVMLLDIISKTEECLNNLNKLGKLTNIL